MTEKNKTEARTANLNYSWDDQEIDKLGKLLTLAYKGQNTYKEPLDLADRVYFYKIILEKDFTMDQVIYGILEFCKRGGDTMPTPKNVNDILNPAPPKVTQSDYIAALEWQKRNNRFDKFTDQYDTIKAFESQGREEKEQFKIHNEQLEKLAKNSVKRIAQ